MVKSPESGKPLSHTGISSKLSTLRGHPAVQAIYKALGPTASLHLVGGCIRDILSGKAAYDIDMSSCLTPDLCTQALERENIKVVPSGISHGTVLAVVEGVHVEITTFRLPGTRETEAYSDSITIDLSGRDFTMNAMALNIETGEFLDPYHGLNDVEECILRTVGDAEIRFKEDPLRLLRMMRFGPAAGRSVHKDTYTAATSCTADIATVSVERIQQELSKILCCPHAGDAIRMIKDSGLLEYVLPELLPTVDCEQNEYHVEDVFEHTLTVLDRAIVDLDVRLAALFHDSGKPASLSVDKDGRRTFYRHEEYSKEICQSAMKRLRFSKDRTQKVANLVALHMRPLECGASGVRRVIRDAGDDLELWLALKTADKSPTMSEETFLEQYQGFQTLLEQEKERLKDPVYGKMMISGTNLLALGIPEGPLIGKILAILDEDLMENPEHNTVEYLTARSKDLYKALIEEA